MHFCLQITGKASNVNGLCSGANTHYFIKSGAKLQKNAIKRRYTNALDEV